MAVETIPVTDRATWLAHRRQDLTASDVAAVAGLDRRRSALQVYMQKTGQVPEQDDSPIMQRGRWMEPAVLAALRDKRPDWLVRRAAVYLRDGSVRLGATPDAVASVPGVAGVVNVQCKVVARPEFEEHWGPEGEPPLEYQVQTTVESHLMDAATGYVAALVIGTYSADLYVTEIPRHEAGEQRARDLAVDFWKRVAAGVPPAPNYQQDEELIRAIGAVPELQVNLDGDNRVRELLELHESLSAIASQAEKDLKPIDAELRHKLGEAEIGLVPGWKVTNKEQSRKPGYVAGSTFRVLRVRRETGR